MKAYPKYPPTVTSEGMAIPEAIETLNKPRRPSFWGQNPKLERAMMLGIEALKRIEAMRISPCTTADELLPGEAKD